MSVAASRPGSLLTVAVPTCNGGVHLADALHSILAQAGLAFELVVSDDRSDDDSLAVVRALAGDRARIEVNFERLGLAGNWNRCAALATTPFVSIFHQDDVMLPGHLAAHLTALASDNSIGFVASAVDVMDEHGVPVSATAVERGGLGPADRLVAPGELAAFMATGNPLRCSAISLRAKALHRSRGVRSRVPLRRRLGLLAAPSRRWKVAWRARPTVRVRWHPESETHRFQAGTADLDETAHSWKCSSPSI